MADLTDAADRLPAASAEAGADSAAAAAEALAEEVGAEASEAAAAAAAALAVADPKHRTEMRHPCARAARGCFFA